MKIPTVKHPTDRPNYSTVELRSDDGQAWVEMTYSYSTPIVFHAWIPETSAAGRWVRENDWGPTTGKHFTQAGVRKGDERVAGEVFESYLESALGLLATYDHLAVAS